MDEEFPSGDQQNPTEPPAFEERPISKDRDTELSDYLKSLPEKKLLTADEEKALAVRIQNGDESAKKEFIESNLRLVISVAKHFRNRGLDFLDLIQEGNIGLMVAVDKFDPEKGTRFTTYAADWIKQRIRRALSSKVRLVRIPEYVYQDLGKILRVTREFTLAHSRPPSIRELAEVTKLTVEHIEELQNIRRARTHSIDGVSSADEDGPSFNLEDSHSMNPAHESIIQESLVVLKQQLIDFREHVLSLSGKKSERNVKIFFDRYGLNDNTFKKYPAEEIGIMHSMSRQAIEQIINGMWTRLMFKYSPIYSELGKEWLERRLEAARANDLKLPLLSKYATPSVNEGVLGNLEEMEDSQPVDDAVD